MPTSLGSDLCRCAVVREEEIHHSLLDGWSPDLMLSKLHAALTETLKMMHLAYLWLAAMLPSVGLKTWLAQRSQPYRFGCSSAALPRYPGIRVSPSSPMRGGEAASTPTFWPIEHKESLKAREVGFLFPMPRRRPVRRTGGGVREGLQQDPRLRIRKSTYDPTRD